MGPILESWRLFWALALVTTIAVFLRLAFADLRSVHGTESIIVHTVLCALPWLLVAFAASSLASLWPSRSTRWLLANRRYFGLAFGFGMIWHFLFVGYFMLAFRIFLGPLDLTLDLLGLIFLIAMTLTSFRWFARRLHRKTWLRLHRTGIYTLWFLPTYFFLDDFHRDHDHFHAILVGLLVAPLLLRGLAWARHSGRIRQAMRRTANEPH